MDWIYNKHKKQKRRRKRRQTEDEFENIYSFEIHIEFDREVEKKTTNNN